MAAAEVGQFCNICELDPVFRRAITFCPECDEFLCSECDRVHTGSNASKQHDVIKIEDYQNLPDFILNIKNRCYSHKSKYEYYCKTHCRPCCVLCIRNEHRKCDPVYPISEVTDNAKSSTTIKQLEKDLLEIEKAFETVSLNISTNITEINQQKTDFQKTISKLRKNINCHLDTIERQIIDDLSKTQQKSQGDLQNLLSEVKEKKKKFTKIHQDLKTLKKYGSNIQTFIGAKEMVATKNEQIKKLEGTLEFEHYRINFRSHPVLFSFLECVPNYGSVSVARNKIQHYLISGVKSQGEIPTSKHLTKIPIIVRKTTVQTTTGNDEICIHGCDILPDGKLLFADTKNNKLIMCSTERKYDESINIPGSPCEVKYLYENVVAVTLPDKRKIVFVDVTTKEYQKYVDTVHECFGSDTNNQKLIVRVIPSFSNTHAILYNFNGDRNNTLSFPGLNVRNISVRNNRLTCSDTGIDTVYMYKINGEHCNRLWTFKDQKVLRRPRGLAMDKRNYVFVAGYDSNNVVELSSDGKFCREFLSVREELMKPYTLRLNIERDELLVCNKGGQAFLFSLVYK